MSAKTILCVDDEQSVLELLEQQLRHHYGNGIAYSTAQDGERALELIAALEAEGRELALVVTDWMMPGMRGDEFLVRLHETHPDVVKVMLTGRADDEAIARAESGANLFRCLRKPWAAEELYAVVDAALAYGR